MYIDDHFKLFISMYLGLYPDGGFGGAPPSRKLKPNTYEESKLMVTHGKPKPVSQPCAPEPPPSST